MWNRRFRKRSVVRQERLSVDGDRCWAEIEGDRFGVQNVSYYGLSIEGTTDFEWLDDQFSLVLYYEKAVIGKYSCRKVLHEQTEGRGSRLAVEIVGEPIMVESLRYVMETYEAIEDHLQKVHQYMKVPPGFKQVVYQMVDWLQDLKIQLDSVNKIYELPSMQELEDAENAVIGVVTSFLKSNFPSTFDALAKALEGVPSHVHKIAVEYFREKLRQIIYQDPPPGPQRASVEESWKGGMSTKESISHRRLFSACLYQYFVDEPALLASEDRVKHTMRYLSDLLKKFEGRTARLLFIGSDSIDEILRASEGVDSFKESQLEIYVTEESDFALKRLQHRLKQIIPPSDKGPQFHFLYSKQEAAIEDSFPEEGFDFIYLAGMADYMSDMEIPSMAKRLYQYLSSGGELVISSYSVSNPNNLTMSIALDWDLNYRTNEDFEKLLSSVGDQFKLDQRGSSANLFCTIAKNL